MHARTHFHRTENAPKHEFALWGIQLTGKTASKNSWWTRESWQGQLSPFGSYIQRVHGDPTQ